jgi:hypothetical protein
MGLGAISVASKLSASSKMSFGLKGLRTRTKPATVFKGETGK